MEVITRAEAIAAGSTTYFTGVACKNGHIAKRWASDYSCNGCRTALTRANYAKNRDARRAYYREWSAANPEKKSASRGWSREAQSEYRAKNKSRVRAWIASRRSAKLNATPPWLTIAHKAEIVAIYQFAELMTQITGSKYEVDHEVLLISDRVCGLHAPWNLRAITSQENRQKGNRMEFA